MSYVYCLHFDRPYPSGRHPQHYIGVSADPKTRFAEHSRGNQGKGGALPRAFARLGIGFVVVLLEGFTTPRAAFERERQLKKAHNHARICELCKEGRCGKDDRSC